ncbi:MAG: response regulator transcription factor [Bacteroidales bacterium]|jgi:two-component system, OmpR family, response regulator|nr:DNA-binding response regulator [Lentimicrobiaceae bacterium]MDG1136468.1 response regulator transcription factor [Bacteroidales bacterium]MDG1902714.1 response regulator transcription factor [Bacteroidales bacterium]MDG2081589.1 response regulator transcription factor [Bacteroidales bacterium]|tara:strand:- start:12598 stop:13287 length:690 start_codon:yes stop_codon:yes gene_type:complete
MENIRILLAEDDKNLGTILKAYLEAKNYPTLLCQDGKEAYEAFKREEFDFCVLDIMMPEMDGFTLAKKIKKIDNNIPILFLSAKAMQEDKKQGFEIGADDYLTKPFSMEELIFRINAIVRRSKTKEISNSPTEFRFGKYTFEYNRQMLSTSDSEQKLTSKEAELLKLLCENMNNVLDRTVALNKIWFDDSYFNARSMDVYITKLRKYLKSDTSVELINVHGVGFKLVVS